MVKSLYFHCRGQFDPWFGNKHLTCLEVQPKEKKKRDKEKELKRKNHHTEWTLNGIMKYTGISKTINVIT